MVSRIDRALAVAVLSLGFLAVFAPKNTSGDDSTAKRRDIPIRVLILSDGGDKVRESAAVILRQILSDSRRFEANICESPVGLTATTLASFDVVVDDVSKDSPANTTEDAIAGFVESGKGLVVTHEALASSRRRPKYWPLVSSGDSVEAVHFLDVKLVQPEHPIVKGMNGEFRTADALLRLKPAPATAEAIATAREQSGSGEAEPVLVANAMGKGRVVGLSLGHDASAMHENSFRSLFAGRANGPRLAW